MSSVVRAKIQQNENNMVDITVQCHVCGQSKTFSLTQQEYRNYISGAMNIQDALPNMLPGDREMLLSGICDSCFDKMFS